MASAGWPGIRARSCEIVLLVIKQRLKKLIPARALAAWQRRPTTSLIWRRIDRTIPAWAAVLRAHFAVHHRFPNILNPQTFNDKVVHRILFDRRPLLTEMADKYAARNYVEKRLGSEILPLVYCVTVDPSGIPFDEFPGRFVVKATHGSGWVRVVHDKSTLDIPELIATCNRWLGSNYYDHHHEWPYKNIVPRIMVEEFIDDGHRDVPNDYRLYVFGGTVRFIQVEEGKPLAHRRGIFNPEWVKQDVTLGYPDLSGDVPRPKHLDQMISAAEALSKEIEFVRADFYDTAARIYFGELTTTPMCGLRRFKPYEFDVRLGRLWQLPSRHRAR